MVEKSREAQRKVEDAQRKGEEEREADRQQKLAIMTKLAALKSRIDKLEKEKQGGAQQNNFPHVLMPDEIEYGYNQNHLSDKDDASSAASHQMPFHNGLIRNTTKKRTYNVNPLTDQTQKEVINQGLRRIKREKNILNMDGKRKKPVVKQDRSRYTLCSIVSSRHVAEGIIISDNPHTVVGGQKLGPHFVEMFVDKVIVPEEPLVRSPWKV